jgi:uncharacterized membrane protein YiaA
VENTHEHKKRVDTASLIILVITLALFLVALYEKGFTRELLLEAGVFLISVKLVLGSVKADLTNQSIEAKLDQLLLNDQNNDRNEKSLREKDPKNMRKSG